MAAQPFGILWSETLAAGCETLGVEVRWVLAVFALESGFKVDAKSGANARGLWQKMPLVIKDQRTGKVLNTIPYAQTDPVKQLEDYFTWCKARMKEFSITQFPTRESLYCLNFAPARLMPKPGKVIGPGRVIYSADKDLHPDEYFPKAVEQNIHLIPLDPKTGLYVRNWIEMRDFGPKLDLYVGKCREKYELEASLAEAIQGSRVCQ